MKKIINEVIDEIKIDKEVIDLMPKKGVKALRERNKKIEELQIKYKELAEATDKEMRNRYNKILKVSDNPDIPGIKKKMEDLNKMEQIIDKPSSFEKMNFDELMYKLNGYYKQNLEVTNQYICDCIIKFREVGIKISAEDFNICEDVHEYMKVLLDELDKGNSMNSERLKKTFEKIYWKCSEIIVYIYVNIKYLYEKNEKTIDKVYATSIENTLKFAKTSVEEIKENKLILIRKLQEIESVDSKIIAEKFLNNDLDVNDFKQENYLSIYNKLVDASVENLDKDEKANMDENIKKLYYNCKEYLKYTEFKFINEEILKIRQEILKENEATKNEKGKDAKKNEYEIIKKQIKETEDKIFKLNEEISSNNKVGIFKKKIDEKIISEKTLERNSKISDLKNLYTKEEQLKIKEEISKSINDASKLLDVLKLGSFYYGFLARTIIKKNPEIEGNEIEKMISDLRKFVEWTDFSVINNISVSEKKEIAIVIKDRYKLFGMVLTKDDFGEANIEDLIKQTQIITEYNNIQNSSVKLEDIQYAMKAREVLKTRN